MANPGEELSSINFASMIGGPLKAVIEAQSQAAISSVAFIKAVGFKADQNGVVTEPIMVSFKYKKLMPKTGAGTQPGDTEEKSFELTVPILTMLPIPFIRIEETTIDFNAKIVATEFKKTDVELGLDVGLAAKGGFGPVSAELKVNFSYKKKDSQGNNVERTYSMAIHVRAVQDEMPAGTERLLSILENSIKEKAAA
jgi:hypothetical protein